MRSSVSIAWVALAAILLIGAAVFAADPSAEPEDKSSCTGTCSTCPGKAKAMLGLAEFKVAVVEAPGLSSDDVAQRVKDSVGALAGVESCVPMAEDRAVWVAYDAQACSLKRITAALTALKLKPGRNYVLEALPKLGAKQERCVVYSIVPPGATHDKNVAQALSALPGLSAQRLDRMFNMVIANYDPAKLEPARIKQALLKLGYPAGLPGEEITQP
jgi:hypothetical protein